ncbi:DUF6907 domain-containing protein [Streptomyces sp. NBC_01092]|uniref:DUF6907 domain-containing protein n=1 Tax=Streptomyces sp. NBC_01092 TaxID=2903748 RepID=UPI0038648EF2
MPPAFGPTEILGDEGETPFAVVRVALALPREQLRAALAFGHAEMAGEPPLSEMSVADIRREVEGYLGANAVVEAYRETVAVTARLAAPEHRQLRDDLDAALDRAYRPAADRPLDVQEPRYGDGTVTLQTLDHGDVTVPEPDWCAGHDGEQVGTMAEISHDGPHMTATVDSEDLGAVPLMRANLTHAPYLELRPEPHPVAYVEGLEAASFDADGLRALVAEGRAYLDRLEAMAAELDELAEEGSP